MYESTFSKNLQFPPSAEIGFPGQSIPAVFLNPSLATLGPTKKLTFIINLFASNSNTYQSFISKFHIIRIKPPTNL
jgi:hypothetical protein